MADKLRDESQVITSVDFIQKHPERLVWGLNRKCLELHYEVDDISPLSR